MADYKSSISKVLLTEGDYSNDKTDSGLETYKGISRKFWSNWEGWSIVDALKMQPNFPRNLSSVIGLQNLVIDFYKINFWNPIDGDNLNDQSIADLLVDSAVNEGISPAIKRAQVIVGLTPTGHIDDQLLEKLNSLA